MSSALLVPSVLVVPAVVVAVLATTASTVATLATAALVAMTALFKKLGDRNSGIDCSNIVDYGTWVGKRKEGLDVGVGRRRVRHCSAFLK